MEEQHTLKKIASCLLSHGLQIIIKIITVAVFIGHLLCAKHHTKSHLLLI